MDGRRQPCLWMVCSYWEGPGERAPSGERVGSACRLGLEMLGPHSSAPRTWMCEPVGHTSLRQLPRDGSGQEKGVCPSSTLGTVTSDGAPLFCGLSPDLGWTGSSSLGAGSCRGGNISSLLLGGAGQAGPQASNSQAPAGKGGHPLCAPVKINIGKLILNGVRTP